MIIFGRAIVLGLLLVIGLGCLFSVGWLVRGLLVPSFQIRKFEVLTRDGAKNEGEVLSGLLAARIRAVEEILAFDFDREKLPAGAIVENLGAVVRGQPPPHAQKTSDVEFKVAEMDVAGIAQKAIDIFHRGQVLEGSVLNSGKGAELVVHFPSRGVPGVL